MSNKDDKSPKLLGLLQDIFINQTRTSIIVNLIAHKELTVKQLVKLTNMNSSTITRNLKTIQELNFVEISRTKTIRNLNINYWKIHTNFPLKKIGDMENMIITAIINKDFEVLKKIITAIQQIVSNTIKYRADNISWFLEKSMADNPTEFLSFTIVDKKTGNVLIKEITRFIDEFMAEHKKNQLSLDKIDSDSFSLFTLVSQFPEVD